MKTIISGGRDVGDARRVFRAIQESGFEITEVIQGEARGVDQLAVMFALARGLPLQSFPADWKRYGTSAGPRRNLTMVEHGEQLIAIPDLTKESPGTEDIIMKAKRRGLKVYVDRKKK